VTYRGERIKRGVKLWPVGADTAKATIYGRLRLTEHGPGYVHLGKWLPSEVFEQLTAERLVTKYYKGRPRLEWMKPPGRRNEALDCAVYALVAAHYLGVPRWKEPDWQRAESRVRQTNVSQSPAASQQSVDAKKAQSTPVRTGPAPMLSRRVGSIGGMRRY